MCKRLRTQPEYTPTAQRWPKVDISITNKMDWSRSKMLKSMSSNWHSQNQTNNNKNSLAPEENQVIILKTGFKKWKPLFSPTLPINIIVQGEPNSLEHIHFATLNDLMDLEQGSWIAPNITHTHTHTHTRCYVPHKGGIQPYSLHRWKGWRQSKWVTSNL